MSQIPIRPIASPVDIFAPDAVAPPATNTAFDQLARSLASFSAQIGQYAAPLGDLRRREGQQAAAETKARLQLENMQQFREAVNRGEISEDDNPWKIRFLRQMIAADEASAALAQWEVDYEQNAELRFNDDPAKVTSAINARLAGLLEGRPSDEAQAIISVGTQYANEFTSLHRRTRRAERAQAFADTFQQNVRREVNMLVASLSRPVDGPESGLQEQEALGHLDTLQGLLDAATAVMPEAAARDLITRSITDIAVDSLNPNVARRLFTELRVGGRALIEGNEAEVGALEARIEQISLNSFRQQRAMEQERLNAERDQILQGAYRAVLEGSDPSAVLSLIEQQGDLQLARSTINMLTDIQQGRDLRVRAEVLQRINDGGSITPDELDILRLTIGASMSDAQLERVVSTMTFGSYPRQTNPDSYAQIQGLIESGDFSAAERAFAVAGGNLTRDDAQRVLTQIEIGKRRGLGTDAAATNLALNARAAEVDRLFTNYFIIGDPGSLRTVVDDLGNPRTLFNDPRLNANLSAMRGRIRADMAVAVNGKQVTDEQVDGLLRSLWNKYAPQYGVPNFDTTQRLAETGSELQSHVRLGVDGVYEPSTRDLSRFTWDGSNVVFNSRSGPVSVPIRVLNTNTLSLDEQGALFAPRTSPEERASLVQRVMAGWVNTAASLGIPRTDDQALYRFMSQQIGLMPAVDAQLFQSALDTATRP